MWTSFSTMVGSGVRGKGDGIAHGTIAQVGVTIRTFLLFMVGSPQVGRTTIGNNVGKDISGNNNEYPTNKSRKTGKTGKRADIGRSKILGVSKGWSHSNLNLNMENPKKAGKKNTITTSIPRG